MFTRITAIIAACVALAGITFGAVEAGNASAARAGNLKLSREVSDLNNQVTSQETELGNVENQVNTFSNQLNNLTQPSDPLGNYDLVCQANLTDLNGNTATYYYPCTDNAQTIPQPGN